MADDKMIERVAEALETTVVHLAIDGRRICLSEMIDKYVLSLDGTSVHIDEVMYRLAKEAIEAVPPVTTFAETLRFMSDKTIVGLVMMLTGGSANPNVVIAQLERMRAKYGAE